MADEEVPTGQEALEKLSDDEILAHLEARFAAGGAVNKDTLARVKSLAAGLQNQYDAQQPPAEEIRSDQREDPVKSLGAEANLSRIRELVSRQDIPFYMQLFFNKGDHFSGRTFEQGHHSFLGKGSEVVDYSEGRKLDIPDFFKDGRVQSNLSQSIGIARKLYHPNSCGIALISNIDGRNNSAIYIQYRSSRISSDSRGQGVTQLFFALPDVDAHDLADLLKQTPISEGLSALQTSLHPELNNIAQVDNFKELIIGEFDGQEKFFEHRIQEFNTYAKAIPQPPSPPSAV